MRTVDPEIWHKEVHKCPRASSTYEHGANGLELTLRNSFWDTTREYWATCSLRGQPRMADTSLSKLERYARVRITVEDADRWQHGAVMLVSLCCGVWAVWSCVAELRGAPAQLVTRHTAHRSIQHIPFPAVALCSSNVIARGPLHNFTKFLSSRDGNNSYSARFIRDNLLQFGSLLTLDLPSVDVDVNFMQFLARADPGFSVTRLMGMLSSPCRTMLRRCSWRGDILPCDRVFATRVTPLGFCCVFNSRYYNEDVKKPPKYLDMVGQEYGLSVIVQQNPDEFDYIRRASVGVDVLLFDGSEYPILEGGGVRMYPMQQNTSAYMSVAATAQQTVGAVAGCRRRAGSPGRRGYAWCLTECRRRTLASLCGCRLHTLPPDPNDNTFTCSLINLTCLNKHKEKLIYYFPDGYSTPALEEEVENGQVCSECEPACARRLYSASVSVARASPGLRRKLFRQRLTEGAGSLVNATIIRLFYSSEHQKQYSIVASARWYESFATISSLCSGITGATVLAASELVFCFSIRWAHHYRCTARERHLQARPSR